MYLLFNGQPLPAKVGLLGWSIASPKVTQRTIDVPDRRGLIYAGSKLGSRGISFHFALLAENGAEAVELHKQLCEWALSENPAPLVLPTRESQYIMAQCDDFPAPDMEEWWRPFDVGFICASPEFIDIFPHSHALDSDLSVGGFWTLPIVTGGRLSTPVKFSITLNETVSGLDLWLDDTRMHLDGSIAAGALAIDTEAGAVTLDGADITYLATLDSDLTFNVEPGAHTVRWPTGVDMSGTIEWRERWL